MKTKVAGCLCLFVVFSLSPNVVLAQGSGKVVFEEDKLEGILTQHDLGDGWERTSTTVACDHPESPAQTISFENTKSEQLSISNEVAIEISAALSLSANLKVVDIETAISASQGVTSTFLQTSKLTTSRRRELTVRPNQCFHKRYSITARKYRTDMQVQRNPWGPLSWSWLGDVSWFTYTNEKFHEVWTFDPNCGEGAICKLSNEYMVPVRDPNEEPLWATVFCGEKSFIVPLFWQSAHSIKHPDTLTEIKECETEIERYLGLPSSTDSQ